MRWPWSCYRLGSSCGSPVMKEQGVIQDKRQVRGVQCVKVNCLMVITKQLCESGWPGRLVRSLPSPVYCPETLKLSQYLHYAPEWKLGLLVPWLSSDPQSAP